MDKKTTLLVVAAGLVIAAAIILIVGAQDGSQEPYLNAAPSPVEADLSEANFSETGYISDREPERANEGMYFVYDEPGKPAQSLKLIFSNRSVCTFDEQSMPCLALSLSIDAAAENKPVFVEGVSDGKNLTVLSFSIDRQAHRRFGFIRAAIDNGQNVLVDIDEVDFLTGNEARTAAAVDTDCTLNNAADCVATLENDFYIRNVSTATERYVLTEESDIRMFVSPGSPDLETVSLDEFMRRYPDPDHYAQSFPFLFVLDGATITILEEQYLP